jgi:hypothetical protein
MYYIDNKQFPYPCTHLNQIGAAEERKICMITILPVLYRHDQNIY